MADHAMKQAVEADAQRLVAKSAADARPFSTNKDAALYSTADNMGLGDAKTDEVRFMSGGDSYIAQGFVDGILYVKDGDWTNFHKIQWPVIAPQSPMPTPTGMGTGASSTSGTTGSMNSSTAPHAGTPIGASGSSGGLESGTTGAAQSTPAQPAATPVNPTAEPHHGGLGGMLGDLAEKVEDAIKHKPGASGGKPS